MNQASNFTDHFLIAMPNLGDPNFSQTVTYMVQHSQDGALGIVINRPTTVNLGEIMKQMNIDVEQRQITDLPTYYGGPVQPERGFVIHNPVGNWESSLKVSEAIAMTTSRDVLEAIATGKGPNKVLIALGYAGWGEGQLEREIIENAWLNAPAVNSILFDKPATQRWKSAAEHMGVNLDTLSGDIGHA